MNHDVNLLPIEQLGNIQNRSFDEIDQHNQQLLSKSSELRKQFFSQIDTSSLDAYEKSIEYYRNYFGKEVIGLFDDKLVTQIHGLGLLAKLNLYFI